MSKLSYGRKQRILEKTAVKKKITEKTLLEALEGVIKGNPQLNKVTQELRDSRMGTGPFPGKARKFYVDPRGRASRDLSDLKKKKS